MLPPPRSGYLRVPRWAIADPDVGIRGNTHGPGALSIGISATTEGDGYLDGGAHDKITGLDLDVADVRDVERTRHEGTGTLGTRAPRHSGRHRWKALNRRRSIGRSNLGTGPRS